MDPILERCIRRDGPFTISDGQQVDEYLDMYRVLLGPHLKVVCAKVNEYFAKYPILPFSFVAGRETAGAILAVVVARYFGLQALVIRSRERDHGTKAAVEMSFEARDILEEGKSQVLLIDDVSSAGVGMLDSICKLRYEGFDPILAYSLVYRGLGAHKIAEEQGVPFEYMFYYPEEPYLRRAFTS